MRERSLREARAIARLNHANVVRIFDVLRTDGDPWIVMEYVASRSLQDTLAEDGPVSAARAVEIGLGVLGALQRRAQGRRHAPRRQAGQRAARRRRPGGADRLRSGHDPGRPERDPHRHGARLARVHLAGAGPGRHGRAGGRPVVAGRDALRGGRGQVAVRPAVGDRHPGRAGHRADAAAEERRPAQGRAQRAAAQGPERADHRRGGGAVAAPRRRQAVARASHCSTAYAGRGRTVRASRARRWCRRPRPAESVDRPVSPPPAAAATRRRLRRRRDARPPMPRRRPSSPPVRHADPTALVPADSTAAAPAEPTATIDRPPDAECRPGRCRPDREGHGRARHGRRRYDERRRRADCRRRSAGGSGAAQADHADVAHAAGESGRPRAGAALGRHEAEQHPTQPADRGAGGAAADRPGGGRADADQAATTTTPAGRPDRCCRDLGARADLRCRRHRRPPAVRPSPTASATPSVDPNALPAGWKLHKDPAGFALPMPDGWVRRSAGGDTVVFDESNGPGELLVQWTQHPEGGRGTPTGREQEPDRKNARQQLPVPQHRGAATSGRPARDWEWLETRDGQRIHVRNRGFVTAKQPGLRPAVGDRREGLAGQPAELRPDRQGFRARPSGLKLIRMTFRRPG